MSIPFFFFFNSRVKCIKRMNGGEWYITTEISQRRGGTKKKRKRGGERGSWEARGARNSHPRPRSPFSLRRRAVWSYVPSSYSIIPPTSIPTVTPSEPNFWTHSLQFHCNGFAGSRFRLSLGPIRKTRPHSIYKSISSRLEKFLYCLDNQQWHLSFAYPLF